MKKLTLLLAIFSSAYCNAQEASADQDVVHTSHGTFNSSGLEIAEVKANNRSGAKDVTVEHSETKTRDGGTSTLVRFNSKNIQPFQTDKKPKEEMLKVSVYPNPAKGIINVAIQNGKGKSYDETYTVKLKNLMGQSLYEKEFNERLLRIDSSELPKGFYLVEITTSAGKAAGVQKVIVQ